MTVENAVIRYSCDWTREDGNVCAATAEYAGRGHEQDARDAGWGAYSNAYIRRDRWTTGARLWFCPLHASVFMRNHGWGGLESYHPPAKWWQTFFEKVGV